MFKTQIKYKGVVITGQQIMGETTCVDNGNGTSTYSVVVSVVAPNTIFDDILNQKKSQVEDLNAEIVAIQAVADPLSDQTKTE